MIDIIRLFEIEQAYSDIKIIITLKTDASKISLSNNNSLVTFELHEMRVLNLIIT